MKLHRLTINNFKGIKNLTLDIQGKDADIYGENATGKTTIADAFLWLLFDKDSADKKDFAIKTLDENNNAIHGLDHEVEAVVENNSRQVTLKKVYKEKWTKKRGQATAEFDGHTTDHYIDDVPVQKNEYVTRIKLMLEEGMFKLLTSPTYFNEQLHWEKRRQILLEVCGDITDADVIASNATLATLPDILGDRTLDDYKKIIVSRRTKINDELKKIPIRIDEVTRSLPDISAQNQDQLKKDIAEIQKQIKDKEQELSRIESGNEVTEKRNQVREIDGQLLALKNEVQGQISKQIDVKRSELQKMKSQLSDALIASKNKKATYDDNQVAIERLGNQVNKLRDDWHQVNDRQFVYEQSNTCPACGQDLPAEQLQAAREKALAAFNLAKANELERINGDGKAASERVNALREEGLTLGDEITAANKLATEFNGKVNDLELLIENMVHDAEAYKEDATYIAKQNERQAVEKQILELQQNNMVAINAVKTEIEQIGGGLLTLQTGLAQFDQYEKGQQRIQELSDEERKLAEEFEKLEGELYLTEQFIRAKVAMLEDKINSKFKLARFKLFDVQVNGAVAECCETTYMGVPYSSGLNNAARVNVGLDIVSTLSEHYKFEAPIFIDNAEAVTQIIPTRGQQIRLIVSEADKALRLEVVNDLLKEVI